MRSTAVGGTRPGGYARRMPTQVNTDAVKAAAKAIFDKRVDAVVQIAQAHQNKLDADAAAAAAEREHTAAWAAGLREGWTEAELKGMDLVPPGRKAPGRPARKRAARASGTDAANGAVAQGDATAGAGAGQEGAAAAHEPAGDGGQSGPF